MLRCRPTTTVVVQTGPTQITLTLVPQQMLVTINTTSLQAAVIEARALRIPWSLAQVLLLRLLLATTLTPSRLAACRPTTLTLLDMRAALRPARVVLRIITCLLISWFTCGVALPDLDKELL